MKTPSSKAILILASCLIAYALGGVAARLYWGPGINGLILTALIAVFVPLALIVVLMGFNNSRSMQKGNRNGLAEQLLQASSPMVLATSLDGTFTYVNPSAERILGMRAVELVGLSKMQELFAPGEMDRISQWLRKLNANVATADVPVAPTDPMRDCVNYVLNFPPSQLRGIDLQLKRSDDSSFPATLYLSAIRSADGKPNGLLAVALDQTLSARQERALRESRERYRDLFENANEMIATLNPAGQFVYVNPVWKSCFGLADGDFNKLESLEMVFSPDCRSEVGRLFKLALEGETVEREPVRTHTIDGRVLDLELSLSRRQKADNPLAIRCMLRDITPQKQRERRLALQLVVSQIIGQSTSPELASMRILESVCLSQGWDAAILWTLNDEEERLQFYSAWGAPGKRGESLIQESMGQTIVKGPDLPGRVWQQGRAVWMEELTSALSATPKSQRVEASLRHGLVTGWAVPVRVGNRLMAILEFYSHQRLREDRETMATLETVCSSLGQMLARSRDQDKVEELHRTQQILLDTIEDGICAADRNGVASLVNPAAGRLLGATPEELTGISVHELLHGARPGGSECKEDCVLLRALTRHSSASAETTIYKRDGRSFPAEFSLTPIMEQGRVSGSVLSFRDISQRFALDRMKDEFVSTVSHELRTPLTSIRGALGLLSAGLLGNIGDKAANLLRIALSNSDRLVRLINDILDLERIQSGREPLAFRPIALAEIIRQAIDGMQPVADAAGVQLIHDANDVQVSADPDRLLQVITNLLSNAVKFSPDKSTVSVTLRAGSSGVTLSVIDQGRGIPADKLDSIFDRFQQVDASDSRQKGGSGLGLAICRTIVQQHGGNIWAERNSVCGSTFRVVLPYHPHMVSTPAATPVVEFDRGRILVADSNATTRAMVANQLRRQGYSVVEASTVDETLTAIKPPAAPSEDGIPHAAIEAILVDIALDGLNGWEILPRLRMEPEAAGVPIVLLSVDHPNPSLPIPTGADGWVSQSPDDETLLNELARVLSSPGEKARILVVEDDVDLAGVIGAVFAQDGIDVKLAHTRQAALDACLSFKPQLLVLDLSLPDGDGFNVVDWLRQHEDLAHLPLVVYSAREIAPTERPQLQLGPTHFLTKAKVQPQQLESLVLTMLRRSRQMEESLCLVDGKEPDQSPGTAAD
ncbi:PAS domain S-box protein [Acidicapsa dinghuensis]|uniref:histidine kinase n=1 Tax=Acidicapsa dinghuensis TaxID=2218256 RepID=A0ABW1EII2_9BACT|nr:PAS domain S-box protein [Acidicapsa dinghuensis]